ncbi:MAG TPA: FMN-binding protein [Streptosporangiaceae bacterium]|nr:FMN-binding protein [Streptosporangiaceae bacterium]
MKRAPLFVLAGTAAGLVGMLSFHTRPLTGTALASPASQTASGSHGQSPGTGQTGATARKSRSAGSASVPAGPAGMRSAVGATEQYGYGQLAVKVSVRGNRITDVTVPVIQVAEQYSQQLASQAIPMLRSEVLSTQTARINGVSGATYTSEAYAASLQAALDKLHVK